MAKQKAVGLSEVSKLIHNNSEVMLKHSRGGHTSKYNKAATMRLNKYRVRQKELSHIHVNLPSITVPIVLKITIGKTEHKLEADVRVYRHKSYEELMAIFFGNSTFKTYASEGHGAEPGLSDEPGYINVPDIMGSPNHDADGFTAVFTSPNELCGFGRFSYSAHGLEEYMRQYFTTMAIEHRHTTERKKYAYKAMTWELNPAARTLLRAFFKAHAKPEEDVPCP